MVNISEITKKYNISTRTLRYYEEEGMIKSEKRHNQRYYGENDLEKISKIIFLRNMHFSIKEIKTILVHPLYIDELLMSLQEKKLEEELKKVEGYLIKLRKKMNSRGIRGADVKNTTQSVIRDLHEDEFAEELNSRFIKMYINKDNLTNQDKVQFIHDFIKLNDNHKILIDKLFLENVYKNNSNDNLTDHKFFFNELIGEFVKNDMKY